jgi:hypothetical protein
MLGEDWGLGILMGFLDFFQLCVWGRVCLNPLVNWSRVNLKRHERLNLQPSILYPKWHAWFAGLRAVRVSSLRRARQFPT